MIGLTNSNNHSLRDLRNMQFEDGVLQRGCRLGCICSVMVLAFFCSLLISLAADRQIVALESGDLRANGEGSLCLVDLKMNGTRDLRLRLEPIL
jgi:hypothetical protein